MALHSVKPYLDGKIENCKECGLSVCIVFLRRNVEFERRFIAVGQIGVPAAVIQCRCVKMQLHSHARLFFFF